MPRSRTTPSSSTAAPDAKGKGAPKKSATERLADAVRYLAERARVGPEIETILDGATESASADA